MHSQLHPEIPEASTGAQAGPRLSPRPPSSPPFSRVWLGAPGFSCGPRLPEAVGWALVPCDWCPHKTRRGHQVALPRVGPHSYCYTFQFLLWVWFPCFRDFPHSGLRLLKRRNKSTICRRLIDVPAVRPAGPERGGRPAGLLRGTSQEGRATWACSALCTCRSVARLLVVLTVSGACGGL